MSDEAKKIERSTPHKVEVVLSSAELDELRGFARERYRTVDEIHQWLLERGFAIGRSSAGRWKMAFDQEVLADRMSSSGELAKAISAAAERGGATEVAKAAIMRLSQVIFEQSVRIQEEGMVDTLDLRRLTSSLKSLLDSEQRAEQIREEFAAKQRAAVAEAEKEANSGKSAADVVAVIKRAMGISKEAA